MTTFVNGLVSIVIVICLMTSWGIAGDFSFGDAGSVESTREIAIGGTSDGSLATDDALIEDIQGVVNRVLGISGMITLIVLLYGGVVMITATGSERFGQGFTVLKGAIIGLLIIGFAWFLASIGFWLAQELGNNAQPAGTGD